jgi:hypothetical protein
VGKRGGGVSASGQTVSREKSMSALTEEGEKKLKADG